MGEAEDKYHALQDMLPDEVAVKALERLTGDVDLMKYDFDGPLPPLPPSNSARGRQKMIMDLSDQGMTIRQIARRYAVGSGHLTAWGTPAQIADLMQEWLERFRVVLSALLDDPTIGTIGFSVDAPGQGGGDVPYACIMAEACMEAATEKRLVFFNNTAGLAPILLPTVS